MQIEFGSLVNLVWHFVLVAHHPGSGIPPTVVHPLYSTPS
jgi:hypothetical protein